MKGGLKRARQEAGHRDGRSMRRFDKRWQARCGQIAQWCKKFGKEFRSPGKRLEVYRSSYRQTVFGWFLDPIAFSVTLLKPGNFRYLACPGSTCIRKGGLL